jgi:acetyl esterase/lipase
MLPHPWFIEDRISLAPTLGKLVVRSLQRPDVKEALIPFGPHAHQKALLLWPSRPNARRRALIYFIHGGGWSSGNPQLFRFVANFFIDLGFPTLLGGYRLAPDAIYPAQIEDCQNGLAAGLRYAAKHGIGVDKLVAGGQSAGAELSALLVYDRSRRLAGNSPPFGGFFSISGPISFDDCTQPDLRKMIAGFMGSDDSPDWEPANPIRYVREDESIPAMLIHGDNDPLVDVKNTLSFAMALMRSPACAVEVDLVPGGHHADLAALFVNEMPVRKKFEDWLINRS